MKIVRLTREHRAFFLDMDPFLMMERLEFPGSFALAALEEKEDIKGDLPAGLMICSLGEDRLMIEWLCVAAEFRTQGVGEQLLIAAFEAAERGGLQTVCAYMNQAYGRELVCPYEEQYLKERLFASGQELPGEWITDIRTMAAHPYLKQKPDILSQAYALRVLSAAKLREGIAVLAGMKTVAMLYPVSGNSALFDPDLSFLLLRGDEVCGGVLVQSVVASGNEIRGDVSTPVTQEYTLYPVLFCATSEREACFLLVNALQAAEKKYAPDTDIHVILRSSTYAPLLEKLLPGKRIQSSYLIAQVEEYVHWKEVRKAQEDNGSGK